MPICIECRHPVKTLWTQSSSAGDKTHAATASLGGSSSGPDRQAKEDTSSSQERERTAGVPDHSRDKSAGQNHSRERSTGGDNKTKSPVVKGENASASSSVATAQQQQQQASKPAAAGHNIRLTVCKKCGRFCDKYVEHDFVVLFIDLVLIKPQVYRHLLHNTLMRDGDRFDPSVIRLGVLLLLFDVYLTWARIEKQSSDPSSNGDNDLGSMAEQPIVFQYLFFLILCFLSTIAFHLSIRFLTSSPFSPLSFFSILPRYSRPNAISTALLVSSSTKLFPILMVIWEYDVPAAARSLGWAVVANNVEALRILLDCKYAVAALLAVAGASARWAVGRVVLGLAGMGDVDGVGGGGDWMVLWAGVTYAMQWAGRLVAG